MENAVKLVYMRGMNGPMPQIWPQDPPIGNSQILISNRETESERRVIRKIDIAPEHEGKTLDELVALYPLKGIES